MAKRRQIIDVYPNRVVDRVVMSAANVESFQQIRFGTGLFGGVALVIHRLEYHLMHASMIQLIDVADSLLFGLTNRDDLTSLAPQNLNILDTNMLSPIMAGSVVGIQISVLPIIKDFSTLPGQGLIIPPNPLFLAADSVGFATAAVVDLVMYYTFKHMSDADYIELVQGMLPANI